MLDRLLGESASRILLFLQAFNEGHGRQIAATFDISQTAIARQLRQLEEAGVLASQLHGNVRIYRFNPRYPFLPELKALLERALAYLPESARRKYYERRTRPRRAGKP